MRQSIQFLSRKLFIFVLFLLLVLQSGRIMGAAYFEYTPGLDEAQKHMACLRLKQANKLISEEMIKHPDNVAAQYLWHYSSFFKIMVEQNRSLLAGFEKTNISTHARINELPDASPYKLFLKSSVHLQSAFVKGALNEYLSAAWEFRSAYQDVQLNEKKFPSFLSHKKELGALKALLGTFPQQYQWIVSAVGLSGDFEGGLQVLDQYIKKAGREPFIEQQQATIIYTLIELNFGAEKRNAWNFYKNISGDYQQNLMQCYVRAYVAGKCGENDIALQTLRARPQSPEYEQIHYLNLLMGNYLLYQLDFSSALWFKKYITFSISKSSLKDAYQKLSWIAWLQNDTVKYHTYSGLMAKHTKDAGSEMKVLNADLAKGIFPSQELLKSRILFDGGYYLKSQQLILKIKPEQLKSKYQKLEYYYRMARIYQEEKRLAEAIEEYKQCLKLGKEVNSYLLPNSCLQLGLIYEEMKYADLARTYYEKVSSYSNYDYESSIHQKARAGLMRLK